MAMKLCVSPESPDFHNVLRQSSIDWILSIKVNPFQKFRNPETGKDEDFYLHVMRAMPKLALQIDWELEVFRRHGVDLEGRITAARSRQTPPAFYS